MSTFYDQESDSEFTALQFTEGNGRVIWEWCGPSKPMYDKGIDHGVTGLRVWGVFGEQKARYGDWIARSERGAWWVIREDEFTTRYVEVGS